MYKEETSLIFGIGNRQPAAWKQLYARYYITLCRYAVKIVGDAEVAADVVQHTIIRLWEKPPQCESEAALRFYLYRSVNNNCLQYIRNKNREDKRLQAWSFDADELETEPLSAIVFEETIRKLQVLIGKLPARRKEVILLAMKQLSNEEIAEKLNVTVHAVKKSKREAYAYIRKVLGTESIYFLFLFPESAERINSDRFFLRN